jgi:ADP-ribose pyrophosphatase YjhB (NUDIX family)
MMIHFGTETQKFLYRVAGVAVVDGHILIQQFENDDTFWCLPGGRVEHGEPAEEALLREMAEELDCEVRVGRLLWVMDNLFLYRGVHFHELGLYFAITLPDGCLQSSGDPWTGAELDGTKLFFRWHPIEHLGEVELKPWCLVTLLRDLPEHTRYVLHQDAKLFGTNG